MFKSTIFTYKMKTYMQIPQNFYMKNNFNESRHRKYVIAVSKEIAESFVVLTLTCPTKDFFNIALKKAVLAISFS